MRWTVPGGPVAFLRIVLLVTPIRVQSPDKIPARDWLLIAETFRLAEQVQCSVWMG